MMDAKAVGRALEQALADTKVELANRMVDKLRERTPKRTGFTASRWQIDENGNVTNDQGDTVMRLNDGSSTKAPAGFIEQAIDETVIEVGQLVKR